MVMTEGDIAPLIGIIETWNGLEVVPGLGRVH